MENTIVLLREHIGNLKPAEKAAAEYILKDPVSASSMSIHEIAAESYVSTSAVIRMCRQIGYEGYRDFHRRLLMDIAVSKNEELSPEDNELIRGDSIQEIARKITQKNIESLQDTMSLLDPDVLERCVKRMKKSERILLFGLGASYVSARDLYQKMLRLNQTCIINEDWHLQLLSARNSTKKDVGIVISYSGQTSEMITCMKEMKKNHTPVIAITRSVRTPVYQLADYRLFVTANESLFRTAAMGSRISQLNMIDILYTAFASSDYDESIRQLRKTHILKNS